MQDYQYKRLNLETLHDLLETTLVGIGTNIVYKPVVASTNTLAMQLARNGAEEGLVVLTDNQTAGKGRQGRRWIDVANRNVLSSTILRPLFPPYYLVMIASLAIVNTIADVCNIHATIKWPNDVLIENRKVAGILIETSHDNNGHFVAILGIGVNINGRISSILHNVLESSQTQQGLLLHATTLEDEIGHVVNREVFIAHLLKHIETSYLALQQETQDLTIHNRGPIARHLFEQWRAHLSTLGRTVTVHQGDKLLSGVAEDVNDQGELLLRDHSDNYLRITWGDVNS